MATKQELINSTEFENALIEGAEYKKDMMTSYKTQNKTNFSRFYDVMLEASPDIQKILDTKKKNRSEADNDRLKKFKSEVSSMYNQVQSLTIDEHLDEGKKTKIEKIVDKIIPVIDILRYLEINDLEKEFERRGLKLVSTKNLEDRYPGLNDDAKRTVLKDVFTSATSIRQKILDDNNYINDDLYTSKVPVELQYDKKTNNAGLKYGDWRKLVDAKAKLIMANTNEAKEKAEEKIEHIATEKQFEVARAELVRDKLLKI